MSDLYNMLRKLGGNYHLEGTAFLSEPERTEELEKIRASYIQRGSIDEALRTAEIMGCELKTDEIMQILTKCVDALRMDKARKVADLLPEPQRTKELEKVLTICMEHEWLTEARKIADILLRR